MAVLADLERLLERVFERSTARLFRARPQAVQLERRVERAMERARVPSGGRIGVPARYRVRLEPADLEAVAGAEGGPEALAGRLADAALAFARAHEYHLAGRPSVAIVADPAVQAGVIEVDAVAGPPRRPDPPPLAAAPAPAPGASRAVPDMPVLPPRADPAPEGHAAAGGDAAPALGAVEVASAVAREPSAQPSDVPAPPPGPGDDGSRATGSPGGIRDHGTETLVFRRPAPAPTRAVLRVVAPDGAERTIEVDGTPFAIGRAADNGLVLADPRVSRHHARLQARRGTLVFTDLASTNGSRVNGVRVDECALGSGDRILLGDTVLLVEQLPG